MMGGRHEDRFLPTADCVGLNRGEIAFVALISVRNPKKQISILSYSAGKWTFPGRPSFLSVDVMLERVSFTAPLAPLPVCRRNGGFRACLVELTKGCGV